MNPGAAGNPRTTMGHNSAAKLDMAAHDARLALQQVANAEGDIVAAWLAYGAALNVGRAEFPKGDNARFSEWCEEIANSNLELGAVHPADQAAAMWADANPEAFGDIRAEFPSVRTVRGCHSKWKDKEAARLAAIAKAEAEAARALADETQAAADMAAAKKAEAVAADAQKKADLKAEEKELLAAAKKLRQEKRAKRKADRAKRDANLTASELPEDRTYRVFYADPPWAYGDARSDFTGEYTGATDHYPTMSVPEMCLMPVADIARDDAVLFLWVTSPLIFEAAPLIEAWGFTYKAMFVWDKVAHNVGHYNSVRHELLLICTRGSCTPDVPTLHDSVVSIDRTGHSSKPEAFRELIDSMYPNGPRLELFRRGAAPEGWDVFGNESHGS